MKDVDLTVMGNTPFSYSELLPFLSDYDAPKNKVQQMERHGSLIRLKRGYYVLPQKVSGQHIVPELIANHLHGPSYVSLTTALRYYGIIPERVFSMSSVTSARTLQLTNELGNFYYVHVSKQYYPIGITIGSINNTNFLIATPEKALCDLIVTTRNLRLRSLAELRTYLEEDIRLDMDALMTMNPDIFMQCALFSLKKETITNITKLIRHDTLR